MSPKLAHDAPDAVWLSGILLKCYGLRGEHYVLAKAVTMSERLGSALALDVVRSLTDFYNARREIGQLARCA